jgi:hypothetical protein
MCVRVALPQVTRVDDRAIVLSFIRGSEISLASGSSPSIVSTGYRSSRQLHPSAPKHRYCSKPEPFTVVPLGDDRVKLVFDEPQFSITPGQVAARSDGDILLGGGIIENR